MNGKFQGALAGFVMLLTVPALMAACGSDDTGTTYTPPPATGGSAGQGGGGQGGSAGQAQGGSAGSDAGVGICLLNNCKTNDECKACGDGRTQCNTATKVCVACDEANGLKCPAGQKCTAYGTCIPSDKTCETDAQGEPKITCTSDGDCVACDAKHLVCDTVKGKCVGCSLSNTKNCLNSEYCKDNKCTPKCPASCSIDNDCGQCGTAPNAAHACFNHKCAKCSATFACPAGQQCINGSCVPPCGLPGPTPGTCDTNEDCLFCGVAKEGGDAGTSSWECKFPINGGNHGKCQPVATGCSDLGKGVVVLPEPWNQYTNTCSQDTDCNGVGIQYNVGKQIRDWLGSDQLDIGIGKLTIQDASVNYGMNSCADIQISETISCGVCVPCKVDTDCKPIGLDPLVGDLFKGQGLAQLAGAFLIDLLYGDIEKHDLNFFCQPVAAGYGVCVPCGNPMNVCATGTVPGSGKCDHEVCTEGTALDPKCGTCATEVCKNDAFCCDGTNGKWDSLCVGEVDKYCTSSCGGTTTKCEHDPCTVGNALDSKCSECVTAVCADDAFCCNTQSGTWDSYCVTEGKDTTKYPKCVNACGGGCVHSECETGAALKSDCSACATAVCAADDFCCKTDWDSQCVTEAKAETACSCP
ncbi:MAG: hypothetical protein HY898_33025 [Deltaproteobacteria bacterium]|nr:hypothetical protein [Deltaproteobacteria bacterium]